MIVVDTGAVLALLDADDRHHAAVRALYEEQSSRWLLPWAILPEVDYLVLSQLGQRVEEAFLTDLAAGGFRIEWGTEADLVRAHALCVRHRAVKLGLVDAVVIAVAERRGAKAIATLDLRHFGAVRIAGAPKLYPRDL